MSHTLMKSLSVIRRVRPYALGIGFIIMLSVVTHAGSWVPDAQSTAFGVAGMRGERGYFSTQTGLVDTVTGNLTMTFADLVLPGNAGMDLAITRSYNQQTSGSKWTFGFTGVPLAAIMPGSSAPSLFMADGSTRALQTGVVSGYWVTEQFWRFDTTTRTLYLPNGWIATYDSPASDWAFLHEVHDVFGNSITPTWDSSHRISSVAQTVDDAGATHTRTVSFGYTGSGALPTSMTYGSRTWAYTYESSSPYRLATVAQPAGANWGFEYSSSSLTVTTPMGGTEAYSFADEDGRSAVSQVVTGGRAVASGTWSFDYSLSGTTETATVTLPTSRHWTYVHAWTDGPDGKQWTLTSQSLIDGSATVSSLSRTYLECWFQPLALKVLDVQTIVQDGVTFTTDYGYSGTSFHDYLQPVSVTESASNHSATRVTTNTYTYSFFGYILPKVASSTVTIGGGSVSTSFDYNTTSGLLTSQTTSGLTTGFSYDAFGNPQQGTDVHGDPTITSYQWGAPSTISTAAYTIYRSINTDGTVASETRNGHTTSFTYDAIGRVTQVAPSTGNATSTTYASDGSSVTVSRGSFWSTTTVDGFGRAIATENVVDARTTATYDAEGHLTFRSMPFTGSTATGNSFSYDSLGRVNTITHADTTASTYSYSGTSVTFTDETSHATTQTWQMFGSPGNGRLTGVTDAASQNWAYTYNAAGSLVSVAAPSGPERTWSYNSTTNRLDSDTQPESGTTTYSYINGRLATSTDARSFVSTYQYDGNDRVTAVTVSGPGGPKPTEDVTFTYDAADNRTRMTTGAGAIDSKFFYDAAERLWKREDKIYGKQFTTLYEYDGNDNLTKITYPSSRVVQYNYDAANRISKVYSGSATYADGLSYHPTGALHEASFGNGTSLSLILDARARPDHLVSGPLDLTYSYYNNGNVSAITDARSSTYSSGFSYDALDRLTGVTGLGSNSFTYDALGNRATKGSGSTQVSYSYSSTTSRLSSASSSLSVENGTFTYDAVGNMTGDGTGTYTYSSRNQMLSATTSGITTRYEYDGSGMRTLKSGPAGQSYSIHGPGGSLLADYVGSFSKESPWPNLAGLSSTITLTWGAVASATYEICVDITDDHACSGSWTSMSTARSTTLSNLPAGTYYWQVRATTTAGIQEADGGSWWRFSVAGTGTFNKVAPVNGATLYTSDVALYWNSLPDVGYSVCWDTTNNNSCDGYWWPNGASLTRTLEALEPGTYYWQVRYTPDYTNQYEADGGVWWSFTKVSGVSGKFSPENGTVGHGSSVWLNWSAVEDSAYWVCVDTTNDDACAGDWLPNGASTSKLLEGLSPGTYYWQIWVQTGTSWALANGGAWWHFTVGADMSEPGGGSSSVTREYIYLGSMLLASVESSSTLTYYHADALGSVRAVTNASGSTLSRLDYAPFGENNGSLGGDPRKFIGGEQDAETAFDYLGARYYRNLWGRFTSVDPMMSSAALTNPQLWNRYSYGLNSPLRFSDPSGMAPQENVPLEAEYGGANCTLGSCQSLDDFIEFYFNARVDHDYATWNALGRPFEGQDNPEDSCLFGCLAKADETGWSRVQPATGDYVAVSFWPEGAGGFGHIGIGLNQGAKTMGWSTIETGTNMLLRIFGAPRGNWEKDDNPGHAGQTPIVLYHALTPGQLNSMWNEMYDPSGEVRTGRYNFIFNNCAQNVIDVLHVGGFAGIPHREMIFPPLLYGIIAR